MHLFIQGLWATQAFDVRQTWGCSCSCCADEYMHAQRMPPLGKVPPLRDSSTGALAPMQRVVTALNQQEYQQDKAFFPRDQGAGCVSHPSPGLVLGKVTPLLFAVDELSKSV